MKERINKEEFIKIRNFCFEKDKFKKMRRQITDWKKVLAKKLSAEKLYKGLLKLSEKK